MRLFLIQLLVVALCFPAIEQLDIASDLDSSGMTHIVIKAEFSDSMEKQVYLNLSATVETIVVKDKTGLELGYDVEQAGGNTIIHTTVPYDYLQFELWSDSFTAKSGSLWDYDFGLSASENISSLSATLSLPKGAVLKSTNGAVQAEEALMISWSAEGMDTSHKAGMRASYELTPAADDTGLFIILAVIVVLVIAAAVYYLKSRKPAKGPEPQKTERLESHPLFKTLDENDKELIREIYRQGGKTTQSHLYLHTHIPKATLSRRIASLENRGILKKSQKGNRNLITLADVFEN